MNEYLESLALDDLSGEQYDLAECIGLEAYKKLVYNYGGLSIYIYKLDTLFKSKRDKEIMKEFNGGNYRELALKYSLAENTIRQIVSGELTRIKNEPLPDQLLFDGYVKDF